MRLSVPVRISRRVKRGLDPVLASFSGSAHVDELAKLRFMMLVSQRVKGFPPFLPTYSDSAKIGPVPEDD